MCLSVILCLRVCEFSSNEKLAILSQLAHLDLQIKIVYLFLSISCTSLSLYLVYLFLSITCTSLSLYLVYLFLSRSLIMRIMMWITKKGH